MIGRNLRIAAGAALLLASLEGGATTIYKSVDAQGRVTYSDQPPLVDEVVDVYEYREPPPSRSALDVERIEAMREVTERMAADRREREAKRARARTTGRHPQPAPGGGNGFYDDDYGDYDYAPGFYEGYRPAVYHRRVHKRRPGIHPPIARPPIARPPIGRPPIGRPPMGRPPMGRPPEGWPADSRRATRLNQYPASLIRRHYTSAARRVFYGESWR